MGLSRYICSLCIWDTAGVERFRTLTRNYYRNVHAALLTYSLDNPYSLALLSKWAEDVTYFSQAASIFLLGTKSDRRWKVSEDSARNFAIRHECSGVFFVSAKTGQGVDNALCALAEKLVQLYDKSSVTPAETRSWLTDTLESRNTTKSSLCCS
ncbi:ras-related protein Rab-18A-like isoform X2 [Gigantopelta aegis]|uniref:ras-related protein Rab-18A-like isoform X2 n=1 Tax=Gigantopelta aegis TaxID=1735272 RepID=UPI001B88ACBE|nr:ras-related protein Rab-18A-like isoform X2 [Gigantopelta aegis]